MNELAQRRDTPTSVAGDAQESPRIGRHRSGRAGAAGLAVVERELPTKIDPRRRVVLERVRSILEEQFLLEFDTVKQQVRRRSKSGPKRA